MPPALRPSRRARLSGTVLALLATASIAACGGVVTGEPELGALPASIAPEVDTGSVSLKADYDRSQQEVNDYWTDDRLTDAAPHDPILPPDRGAVPWDAPTGVIVDPTTGLVQPEGPQTAPSDAGSLFQPAGLAASTQGRLYGSMGGQDTVCSASVVNSAGHDVIATAAHCVWATATDTLADYLIFIPADSDNGNGAPYGRWAADAIVLPTQFTEGAEVGDTGITGDGWAYDFAFVSLAPDEQGRSIQDVTGGQGIAFGIPAQELLVTGYPSAPPFDGLTARYCAADDWLAYQWAYTISCTMTPGSSGGGWLTNYDPTSGSGYLVGTSSFGNNLILGAAPFGATALEIFTSIGGL